jgi:hypothetical protein
MEKINDIVKGFFKHFAGIGVYLIPGIFVLDLVFKQGFFNHRITSWIDLVFLVFWGLILSLPFHYIQPRRFKVLLRVLMRKSKIKDEEYLKGLSDEVELGFVMVKLIIFYFIFKFISYQSMITIIPVIGINTQIVIFILSIILTFVLGYIVIFGYEKIFNNK